MYALWSIANTLAYQVLRLVNPRETFFLAYFAGALAFAAAVMLWRRRGRRRVLTRGLLRLLGTRTLWLHRSTRLDAQLYLMHGLLVMGAYGLFSISGEACRAGVAALLTATAGASPALGGPGWAVGGATALAQFLMIDLAYWALHLAFHRIPALWEIHKVHHSAEVLTPLVEWRQHPVEFVLFSTMIGPVAGAAFGAMGWLFGPAAQPLTLFQTNLVIALHLLTFHHLRHSGVWIAARGWLGRLVHSPAHHHIHHSTDPRHFGMNLGYALSVWDWAFGTLWIPERRGRVRLGVEGEAPYSGVADSLIRPVALAARTLRPAAAPAGAEA